ncbi:hypothetical protein [Streptomyces boluensis]|uniref:Uncharacterized protein n=1 Tax=Streptomyces boluensis TaxID=1775135 RepID=A0A964URY6_9ACTN|nr:hypothetical protein [Streptomyces boluensis]NBE52993.1 hypothetical protein [Streptomyces boluensis]
MDNPAAVAWLCEALPLLRDRASAEGLGGELAEVAEQARNGADIAERLDALRRRLGLPAPGPARSGDVPPVAAPSVGIVAVPGIGGGHPVADVLRCPARACARAWVRRSGARTPQCLLHGQDLLDAV